MMGWALAACGVGAALVLPQLVTASPWQAGVLIGCALLVLGGLSAVDLSRRRRVHNIERRRAARRGYVDGGRP